LATSTRPVPMKWMESEDFISRYWWLSRFTTNAIWIIAEDPNQSRFLSFT
jgi:hypothetical protein